MGVSTSLLIIKIDDTTLKVSIRRQLENNREERLNYELKVPNVNRVMTTDSFIRQYINVVNILVLNENVQITKRNIRIYLLNLINPIMNVNDTITIRPSRYNHSTGDSLIFSFETLDIAREDRSGFYTKVRNGNWIMIDDYLEFIDR